MTVLLWSNLLCRIFKTISAIFHLLTITVFYIYYIIFILYYYKLYTLIRVKLCQYDTLVFSNKLVIDTLSYYFILLHYFTEHCFIISCNFHYNSHLRVCSHKWKQWNIFKFTRVSFGIRTSLCSPKWRYFRRVFEVFHRSNIIIALVSVVNWNSPYRWASRVSRILTFNKHKFNVFTVRNIAFCSCTSFAIAMRTHLKSLWRSRELWRINFQRELDVIIIFAGWYNIYRSNVSLVVELRNINTMNRVDIQTLKTIEAIGLL